MNEDLQEQTTLINTETPLIHLRIKTMDSAEYQIEIPSSGKVNDLKQKIEERLKIPQPRQRLIYQGKLLKDNTDLSQYKVAFNFEFHSLIRQKTSRQFTQQRVLKSDQISKLKLSNNPVTLPNSSNKIKEMKVMRFQYKIKGAGSGIDLVSEIARTINETNLIRRNRRLVFQQNARQYLQTLNLNQRESTEAIRQNVVQMRAMLDSRLSFERAQDLCIEPNVSNGQIKEVPAFDNDNRRFEIGQWIDVKDTIDQWLEAQIIDIKDNQIYVHYNGWGSRWDEWLAFNSPRIAAFRSYTVQNPRSNYLSPFPNIQPDSANLQIPQAQNYDMNSMLGDIIEIMDQTQKMMKEFKEQRDHIANQSNDSLKSEELKRNQQEEEKKQTIEEYSSLMDLDEEQKQPANLNPFHNRIQNSSSQSRYQAADQNLRIIHQASQLAPIMDRVGRMITDFAPHVNNIVKQHQSRVRETNSNLMGNQPLQNGSRRTINTILQPFESFLSILRSNQNQQNQNPNQMSQTNNPTLNNQSLQSSDLRNDSIQSHHFPDQRPTLIQTQIPIMYSPGEISSVANIFDNRLFEENQDSNIEFHIHAFLSPQQQQQTQQNQQPSNLLNRQQSTPTHQNAQVGPSGNLSGRSQFSRPSSQNQNQHPHRQQNQLTQTPLTLNNQATQTSENDTQEFIQQLQRRRQSSGIFSDYQEDQSQSPQNFRQQNNQQASPINLGQNPFSQTLNPRTQLPNNNFSSTYRPVGVFGSLNNNNNNPFSSLYNNNQMPFQLVEQNSDNQQFSARRSSIGVGNNPQQSLRSSLPQMTNTFRNSDPVHLNQSHQSTFGIQFLDSQREEVQQLQSGITRRISHNTNQIQQQHTHMQIIPRSSIEMNPQSKSHLTYQDQLNLIETQRNQLGLESEPPTFLGSRPFFSSPGPQNQSINWIQQTSRNQQPSESEQQRADSNKTSHQTLVHSTNSPGVVKSVTEPEISVDETIIQQQLCGSKRRAPESALTSVISADNSESDQIEDRQWKRARRGDQEQKKD